MMPIYERVCRSCNARFDHLCKVEDRDSEKDCPGCGSLNTEPVMSPTRTHFRFADTKLKPPPKRVV